MTDSPSGGVWLTSLIRGVVLDDIASRRHAGILTLSRPYVLGIGVMEGDIYSHAVGVERTPDGRRLTVSRIVDAPADAVWCLLVDTTRWPEWGPTVAAVDAPTRFIAAGTRGRVRVAGIGVWVPFAVGTFEESEGTRRWTWTVARLPATGHRVDALDGRCRVTFEVPILAAGYVPVCRRALDRIARLAATVEGETGADDRETHTDGG